MDTWKAEPIATLKWLGKIRDAPLPIATKGVGAVLASFSNQDGTSIRPGAKLLRECCDLSESQVRRHTTALRNGGWLILVRSGSVGGRGKETSEYRLSCPAPVTEEGKNTGH